MLEIVEIVFNNNIRNGIALYWVIVFLAFQFSQVAFVNSEYLGVVGYSVYF